VKVAAEQGLIGMICHAVDGNEDPGVRGARDGGHRKRLEKVLARVEEELARMEAAIEAGGAEPGGHTACGRIAGGGETARGHW